VTRPSYTLLQVRARVLRLRFHAFGTACVILVGALAWPYTVDDAFIVARYARNLAQGLGYGMNAHQPSDGVTGPLWLLPGVLACRLHLDPIATAKAIGLFCMAFAVWLALRRLRARSGGRAAALAATLLVSLSPSIGTWAVAGLETGAATLLATSAWLAATRRPRAWPGWLGLCVAMLAWLRPELAVFSAVLLLFVMQREGRAAWRAVALALFGVASVTIFRRWCFGDYLPLSFSAKAGSLSQGLHYTMLALLLSTSVVGVWLAVEGARQGRRDDRVLGFALLSQLGAVVLAGGDWMPGYRLFVPVLPLYALLAGVGVVRRFQRRPLLGALYLALACVLPALDLATRLPELRSGTRMRARADELAGWLRDHARSVALVDVGYLGYASGLEVVDLGGLTDARIARMPGGHLDKHIDATYLVSRNPDAIVLHSSARPVVSADAELLRLQGFAVERRVASLPAVRRGYRVDHVFHYGPGYDYVVLARAAQGLAR
jgi:arabinofuranosyltransferase